MKTRNQIVSISRGIAISAMVMGHANVGNIVEAWVNQFDMALFFICAGICLKESHFDFPVKFIYRKIKGLFVPFVSWVVVFILLHNLFLDIGVLESQRIWRGYVEHVYSVSEIFHKISMAFLMKNSELLLGGYWFCRELLMASTLGYLILKIYKIIYPTKGYMFVSATCAIIAVLGNWVGENYPHFSIMRRTSLALFFFVTGAEIKHLYPIYFKRRLSRFSIVNVVFLLCIVFGFAGSSGMMMSNPKWNVVPMFIVASLTGTILVMLLSARLSYQKENCVSRFLAYAGDHSFIILTFHLLAFKCVSVFLLAIGFEGSLGEFPTLSVGGLYPLVYWVAGTTFPLIVLKLYEWILMRFRRCFYEEVGI